MQQIEQKIEDQRLEEIARKEAEERKRKRWLQNNLDFEFDQYSFYFQD